MKLSKIFTLSVTAYIVANLLTGVVTYAKDITQPISTNPSSSLVFRPINNDPDIKKALDFVKDTSTKVVSPLTNSEDATKPTAIPEQLTIQPTPTPPTETTPSTENVLGSFITFGPSLNSKPVDPNGTIMIPRIGVNSPIAFNVQISDKKYYQQALDHGVAHANGTGIPSEEGSNTYLFAHSTQFEEHIAKYAAVFTKLHQLEINDQIVIFYNGKRYDYAVVEEEIVPSFDVSVLTKQHEYTSLTLQTCWPPGIPKDRFITTAKLISVYDR